MQRLPDTVHPVPFSVYRACLVQRLPCIMHRVLAASTVDRAPCTVHARCSAYHVSCTAHRTRCKV